jgi:SAM-dependent methyltransferase
MPPGLAPLHDHLTFLSPLSAERAAALCDFVARSANGTVVDVGCGWAELLIRVIERGPGLRGFGIDLDADALEHGRDIARTRGVADRLTLVAGDVKNCLPQQVNAMLCIGASQIWGPPVEACMPIDYRSALHAMRSHLARGAPLVYGEGVWTAPPTPAAIEPLAGREDEFAYVPELLDIARDCGFVVVRVHQASLDEWDRFESGYTARYASWLAGHPPEHPDAAAVRTRLHAQSNAYFKGYRGILGMAYLELLAA